MFRRKLSFIYCLLLLLAVTQAHAGNGLQDALDKKITIELKNVILKDALENDRQPRRSILCIRRQ
ncbi:succinate dehydrogenase hydrophobic anchor subunit [Chitinophaga sp. W3I9]